MKRLTCAIALAFLVAVAIGAPYHRSAQPQRRVAEVHSARPHLTRPSFVRQTVTHPVERALPTAEPPPVRHRKFPAWFLRRHIATLRPTIA